MSVYPEKRGGKLTGRYCVEVERDGKRHREFTTNLKEAKKLETRLKLGDIPSKRAADAPYTLADLQRDAKPLWDGQRDTKQSQARFLAAMEALTTVLKRQQVEPHAANVKGTHIKAMADMLTGERGLKPGTANRYVAALSKAFSWAEEVEKIPKRPKAKFQAEGRRDVFVLDEAQEARVKQALVDLGRTDVLTLMEAQMASGCRIGEILKLTPDRIVDDGDGFYTLDLGITKNGEPRHAPVPEAVGRPLKAIVEQGLLSYRQVNHWLVRARQAAGLPTTQPTHAHRHTVATRLTQRDVPTAVVKEFLGHSSLNTTLKYAHVNTTVKKQAARVLRGD